MDISDRLKVLPRRRHCCEAPLLGGVSLPLHDHFYKAREGTGQPGRQSMSGSERKKRALQGHQLEQTETEHSGRSCYMLSRCLSGTDSYYLCKGGA